ncbi:MAG: alpha/beta hydrolase [Solirubrobacterales bacterium]|nr:alpha/beta hydrolase [Solirubrobacterales bacterium]
MTIVTAKEWWDAGATHSVDVNGVQRTVFIRDEGTGPTVTLLHGFPGSSLEWAGIWEALVAERRVIAVDLLGFGNTDKPRRHCYRLDEQVELVLAVWRQLNVNRTAVVAYDYGAIVAQLLLTHHARPEITRAVLLNASVYPELYRPEPIQRALLVPGVSQLVWRLMSEPVFHRSWARVFGPEYPLDPATSHEHWLALQHGDPEGDAQRRVLRYIPERAARSDELTAALNADTPLSFLWGMADPVSGAVVADAIRGRQSDPDLVEYQGVGHAPHLEIPDRVVEDLLKRI